MDLSYPGTAYIRIIDNRALCHMVSDIHSKSYRKAEPPLNMHRDGAEMCSLPLILILLVRLIGLVNASPRTIHIRQAYDGRYPADYSLIDVNEVQDTPPSCTELLRPSEDCMGDLKAESRTVRLAYSQCTFIF